MSPGLIEPFVTLGVAKYRVGIVLCAAVILARRAIILVVFGFVCVALRERPPAQSQVLSLVFA